MNIVDQAILNALSINMGYHYGEKVIIIVQDWNPLFDKSLRKGFRRSSSLADRMLRVFQNEGISADLLSYTPTEARNGADAPKELLERSSHGEIFFLTTPFSLTHTHCRKSLSARGARVASMPGFTLELFEEDGPMNVDYREIKRITEETAERLHKAKFVKITAPGTEMVVEIDRENVHVSSGVLDTPGKWGNLPGAEAYAPPVHLGKSNGFFTVPAGWGGNAPLPYPLRFTVQGGRFVSVEGENPEAEKFAEEKVRPHLFGAPGYEVLAELGIGTNPNLTAEYIAKKGWSALTAEKIAGSAHFANGNSFSMGGKNDVPVHIDWVVPGVKLEFQS